MVPNWTVCQEIERNGLGIAQWLRNLRQGEKSRAGRQRTASDSQPGQPSVLFALNRPFGQKVADCFLADPRLAILANDRRYPTTRVFPSPVWGGRLTAVFNCTPCFTSLSGAVPRRFKPCQSGLFFSSLEVTSNTTAPLVLRNHLRALVESALSRIARCIKYNAAENGGRKKSRKSGFLEY